MELDLERVSRNVRKATTEDLLDRVTVYRNEMEPSALRIIDEELGDRGITSEAIESHLTTRQNVMKREDGTAIKCAISKCYRPAQFECLHWHKVFGVFPLYRKRSLVCEEHYRELS